MKEGMMMSRKKKIALLSIAVLVIGVFAGIGAYVLTQVDFDQLRDFILQFDQNSSIVGIAIYSLQIVVALLPGGIIEVVMGWLFGDWFGLVYCLIGHVLASSCIFLLTKHYGRRFVELFISKEKLERLNFSEEKLNFMTMIVFLIPGTPKDLMTYALGLTKMRLLPFLLISSVSKIPSIYTSTLTGSSLGNHQWMQAALVYLVTGIVSLIGMLWYKKNHQKILNT